MKDATSFTLFIYQDWSTAEAFLRAFIHIDIGDELVWSHEQWAFTSGQRAMQEEVRNALTDGLEDNDLPDVLALLPDEVADPEPKPYSGPALTSSLLRPSVFVMDFGRARPALCIANITLSL